MIVYTCNIVHEPHDICRGRQNIPHSQAPLHHQYRTNHDSADIGNLPDGIKGQIEFGGKQYLLHPRIQEICIYPVEFFLLQFLIMEGTYNPDSCCILLGSQVHLGAFLPDFPEILPCPALETDYRLHQERHQEKRNDKEGNVNPRNQHQRHHQHKNCVSHIRDSVAEQFLEHDGVAV